MLYIEHTIFVMRLSNEGKQGLVSMFYEIEHTYDYIESLTNAEILCEY